MFEAYVGEPQQLPTAAPSFQARCDVPEFNKCEIGRDAYPASNHGKVGINAVVVASIWLVFYAIAALHALVSGN